MVEDQYGIIIEDIIANANSNNRRLNFTQIYRQVCGQYCSTVSKKTIIRWLRRLEERQIIKRDGERRRYNQVYYSMTPARIFERKIFASGSKEQPTLYNEGQQQALEKACILILLQSALGTEIPNGTDEPVLGAVYGYNPDTGRNECLISDKLPGVTMKEVLSHTNIGLGGLFNHIDFTRLLRKHDCIHMIQKVLGVDSNTVVVRRFVRKNNEEIGIEIVDKQLRNFITMCACMMTWIHSRLSDTIALAVLRALSRNGSIMELPQSSSFSGFELDAFKLYLSLYGRRELNCEFERIKETFTKLMSMDNTLVRQGSSNNNNEKSSKTAKRKLRAYIQNRKDEILRSDKNIIAFYHGLIKFDIYVDAPGALGQQDKYEEYRKYVKRDMPQQYHYLTDTLMKVIYPGFLQKYHSNNPKLVEFTKSLPSILD